MDSVGLQYAPDEFGEGSVNDGRYASPKSGGLYAPAENFYDTASGSWYSASGGGGGGPQSSYGPQGSSGSYHNVNHPSHMTQQASSHEHYGMSPHMEAPPHMSTTPQPLPPMSSFRGGSTNGPTTTAVGPAANPSRTITQLAERHAGRQGTANGKTISLFQSSCSTTIGSVSVLIIFSYL
jgi:hypothetical protein